MDYRCCLRILLPVWCIIFSNSRLLSLLCKYFVLYVCRDIDVTIIRRQRREVQLTYRVTVFLRQQIGLTSSWIQAILSTNRPPLYPCKILHQTKLLIPTYITCIPYFFLYKLISGFFFYYLETTALTFLVQSCMKYRTTCEFSVNRLNFILVG